MTPVYEKIECAPGRTWNDGYRIHWDCSIDSTAFFALQWTILIAASIILITMTVFWLLLLKKHQWRTVRLRKEVKNLNLIHMYYGTYFMVFGYFLSSLGSAINLPAKHWLICIGRVIALSHVSQYYYLTLIVQVSFMRTSLIAKERKRQERNQKIAEWMIFLSCLCLCGCGLYVALLPMLVPLTDPMLHHHRPVTLLFKLWAIGCIVFIWPLFAYTVQVWSRIQSNDTSLMSLMKRKVLKLAVICVFCTCYVVVYGFLLLFHDNIFHTTVMWVFHSTSLLLCVVSASALAVVFGKQLSKGKNKHNHNNHNNNHSSNNNSHATASSVNNGMLFKSRVTLLTAKMAATKMSALESDLQLHSSHHQQQQEIQQQEQPSRDSLPSREYHTTSRTTECRTPSSPLYLDEEGIMSNSSRHTTVTF